MRRWMTAAALVLLTGGFAAAQGDLRQEIRKLDLTEAQVQEVVKVVRQTAADLEKARAEAKVTQAKLARLLLEESPARADIEKLVREGLEWDYKVKMTRIDRSLKLRAVVGKDGWTLLSALSLRLLEDEKSGKKPLLLRDEDKGSQRELLKVLRDLN